LKVRVVMTRMSRRTLGYVLHRVSRLTIVGCTSARVSYGRVMRRATLVRRASIRGSKVIGSSE